ncbi:GTP-binding protein LepA [Nocardioides sp. SOB77]|uniref:GTP-binding protein LepA n=1 Tax=Nocardioides oceani TaxID=3058369 RepID=A0ABT8FHU3_9ACTN|nr:GTP-binding protein LepA [Nocardioides oceani]MDN4174262.1 GTP-binding protein LepA [Nocardioides oceani]
MRTPTLLSRVRGRTEPWSEPRLVAHVDRLAEEHPPIDLATCDFSVRRRDEVVARFAPVLDYMARAELEVERNTLELGVLLPHAPDVDRYFYREVWQPQESHHGLALDELQVRLGLPPAQTDLTTLSPKVRAVGALAHVGALQDVVRMLYYLTGMTTERSALLAYHRLHDGLTEMGETAVAQTIITPIRRQEPGHFAFYQLSARGLWAQLADWQRWLVRRLRAVSFAPVAAGDDSRKADVGDMMVALGIGTPEDSDTFVETVARTEAELLGAAEAGLAVPPYIVRSFRECLELARERAAAA